jgi:hypothetical protein
LGRNPFSGTIFVFRAKRADRIKIVAWDGSGLVLFWKRLEHGAFRWPPIIDGTMRLTSSQWLRLLTAWTGRVYMRAMLWHQPQRPESCDGLNQEAGCGSQRDANLLLYLACRSTLCRMISMPCGRW